MKLAIAAGIVVASVTGLRFASPAESAQFDSFERRPTTSRFLIGLIGGGALGDLSSTTPGGGGGPSAGVPLAPGERGNAASMGAVVGYERRVLERWSLAFTGSFSTWFLGAEVDAGYLLRRLDLGFAPQWEFASLWMGRRWTLSSYLAVSVGMSEPFVSVPARRAFREALDSRLGWYAGGALGVTVWFGPFGARVEGGYCRHANSTRRTITSSDPSQAPLVEERSVVDHQLLFTFAALMAF